MTNQMLAFTLRPAARYDRDNFGVVFVSNETVDVTGSAAHSRHHPHRVVVWETRDGVGPDGKPTDRTHTVVLDAEPVVISNPPAPQPRNLGAVRADDRVIVVYPNGTGDVLVVEERPLNDPLLVPVPATLDITRDQLEAWAGQPLTDEQVQRIDNAIPDSTIPEAIGDIAFPIVDQAQDEADED